MFTENHTNPPTRVFHAGLSDGMFERNHGKGRRGRMRGDHGVDVRRNSKTIRRQPFGQHACPRVCLESESTVRGAMGRVSGIVESPESSGFQMRCEAEYSPGRGETGCSQVNPDNRETWCWQQGSTRFVPTGHLFAIVVVSICGLRAGLTGAANGLCSFSSSVAVTQDLKRWPKKEKQ